MHTSGLREVPVHLLGLRGRAGQERFDNMPRIGVGDDPTLYKSKGRCRDRQGIIDLDHPVISRPILGPTVRRQPVVDVIKILEALVPVDE